MLLGPPGAGKTKAFEREAKRNGGCYITARDFLTFDPDPEWEDRTIYIDGLDETRSGTSDGRTPFDGIRAKLQEHWASAVPPVLPGGGLVRRQRQAASAGGYPQRWTAGLAARSAVGPSRPRHPAQESRKSGSQGFRSRGSAAGSRWPAPQSAQPGDALGSRRRDNRLAPDEDREHSIWPAESWPPKENPEHQIAWRGTANATALLDAAGDLCAILSVDRKGRGHPPRHRT